MDQRHDDDPVVIYRCRHEDGLLGFEAWVPSSSAIQLFSVDIRRGFSVAVPLPLVERMRAALEFYQKMGRGKRCARRRRLQFCFCLCWAGVRIHVGKGGAIVHRRFEESIQQPMLQAIGDVFPEEGFAELVMSFVPMPIAR